MEVYVLDKELKIVGILDDYNSLIWTERYAEAGDFQLDLPASYDKVKLLQRDRYLKIKDSNETMIIESISIKTENRAPHMTVTGRSLVSILDRRVVLGVRYFNMEGQDGSLLNQNIWQIVRRIVDENVVTPEENPINTDVEAESPVNDKALVNYHNIMKNNRKINKLQLPSEEYYQNDNIKLLFDPYGKINDKHPKNLQFNGETIYDAVKTVCNKYNLGFTISEYSNVVGIGANTPFVFYIYDGQNRIYEKQPPKFDGTSKNDPVILSPKFDNIANISYSKTSNGFKTIMLATGEEDGDKTRPWAIVDAYGNAIGYADDYSQITTDNEPSDLDLRESIHDLSSEVTMKGDSSNEEVQDLTDEQYSKALIDRAMDVLNDQNKALEAMDGEIINNIRYKVKEDYDLGDIIEMDDGLGHSRWMRVTEIIYAHNNSGYKIYPTLALYEKDEYQQRN